MNVKNMKFTKKIISSTLRIAYDFFAEARKNSTKPTYLMLSMR